MSYLNIIMAVWAVSGIGAILFIRGATQPEARPIPVKTREAQLAEARKHGRMV
jgi:hypothetical protein